ncbi:hypothetical protein FNV43_RR05402 [Rhamnella rubrinervis]|uniref:Uncharacterized protein n=1 Tax=Rhamnella rubrinervis TaxID=2594499 RepID=A0A8K0MR22_9ROSA|nr:hypothetical protein FNV43_RR05402 [Rhamnella rubrinervis]
MLDGSSSNKEVYKYGGNEAEYPNVNEGSFSQDVEEDSEGIKLKMNLTGTEFLHMYHLKKDPNKGRFNCSGWYYVSTRKEKSVIDEDHNSNKVEGWKSKWFFAMSNWEALPNDPHSFSVTTHYRILDEHFLELSSCLHRCIDFAKSQPEANRSYKNLLHPWKVAKYFSREILFGESTMTAQGMKKRLSEIRANERRRKNELKNFRTKKKRPSDDQPPALETSLPLLMSSSLSSASFNPLSPAQLLCGEAQVPRGTSTTFSESIPPKLSYYVKCSKTILSLAVIKELGSRLVRRI